ncbi:MAG: hypothetical protein ABSH01_28580, partial [Terriglobia bacterium]
HASELRAVCANQRPYGSVRGVPGNRYPYRDRSLESEPGMSMQLRGVSWRAMAWPASLPTARDTA